MNTQALTTNREHEVEVQSGWIMLVVTLAAFFGGIALLITSIVHSAQRGVPPDWYQFIGAIIIIVLSGISMRGFFTLQPNEARVLILFGAYKGTVRKGGFHWGNPFYANGPGMPMNLQASSEGSAATSQKSSLAAMQRKTLSRYKVSLRSRNFNGEKLKVNDKRGNPIEIAAVVVWRVDDTAQAIFDVEDFENYVRVQSESAVRHLASAFAYDHGEENEITLRSGVEEISLALKRELQERLSKAGVMVDEARLTHLAYAPEIAQAMLRRQQAEAVIAARQKIVHGAVSMVEMALKELADKHVVQLDDERKAAMVSNLMVVLCGESEVHPVVNAGTLYPG
jgi:regulator of protease activity HflC (stomatin/prohibitin superfamily)